MAMMRILVDDQSEPESFNTLITENKLLNAHYFTTMDLIVRSDAESRG